MSKTQRLLLIDGSGFIFRAFHSLPPLTRTDGTPVGAVYGFTNMLLKLLDDMPATHVAVIFDAARKTFRNDIYPEYKAHRPPAPDDLVPQFSIVREATEAMNIPAIDLPNFEADDIIATYAREAQAQGIEAVIVSSDKDLMQLIGDGVVMYDAMKNRTIAEEQVMEKFGVMPDKVIEVQALIGDSSDNVPGVPGIGPKGAAELIGKYGDLETLLSRAEEIKQPKRRQNLIDFADIARVSKELVTLKVDCENLPAIDTLHARPREGEELLMFLKAQNFTSLYNRMAQKVGSDVLAKVDASTPIHRREGDASSTTGGASASADASPALANVPVVDKVEYERVDTLDALQRWVKLATSVGRVAFDVETDSLNAKQATLVGFSLSVEPGKACYVPLNHRELTEVAPSAPTVAQTDLFGAAVDAAPEAQAEQAWVKVAKQIPMAGALALLKPLLEDDSVLKIGQNIKYDMLVMEQQSPAIHVAPIEDTMLISYCLGAGARKHNMDDLAKAELGMSTIPFSEVAGKGKAQLTFDQVPLDKACEYAAEDADITLRLWMVLKPQLIAAGLVSVYERFERPLLATIVEMENTGVCVDREKLVGLSATFSAKIAELETVIHALAGREFNIGSPKQLGEVLFDELGLEGGKKSGKTGAYATGVEVLEELAAGGAEIAGNVVEWRQLSKLKSTYSDALVKQINPTTKRVHTSYSLASTSTGRLSSSDPNLQNIPVRTEEGRKIREAFVAQDGWQLFSADYSQIELRLLAHVAQIPSLQEAFKQGRDIHAATASQMFGVPIDEVTSDLRRQAKTINFGIIYGISAHGLAVRLGIGRKDAADYIAMYFEQYPGIRQYMEDTKEQARANGYVTTLWNRRCHTPYILDKNGNRRAFAERAAINAPLQGSAADIIKRAMIDVDAALRAKGAESKMLLQVHDELIFEIPPHEADWVPALITKTMEQAAQLSIPLVVDSGIGLHWGEIH